MGYTHYWKRADAGTATQYTELRADTARLITNAIRAGLSVRGVFGQGQPEFSETRFGFNGDDTKKDPLHGTEMHESFVWYRNAYEVFDFCKTAMKPYDAVVTAALIRAKEIYGDSINIRSDGEWDEWQNGRILFEYTFARSAPMVLS